MNTLTWIQQAGPSPESVSELSQVLSTKQPFPQPLASILLQRGITDFEQARTFFRPDRSQLHDPFLMKDMEAAVSRLLLARQKSESILLFGDYDVDGTTAVSLMLLGLRALGYTVEYYIPDRYEEGYGLSYQGIEFAKKQGHQLIISLDCGIKALDKVRFAQQKEIEVIICDHHTPGEELPAALAVLDPKRPDCAYPFKELTGCGVGMKLLQALINRLKEAGEAVSLDPIDAYGDLLVLSIACDIVPIVGENRSLAYLGLQKLRSQPLPGIKALMDQAKQARSWDISDLVFFIGPRINAAGRLEHGSQAVEVLTGEGVELNQLAAALEQSNEARKSLDQEMTQLALTKMEDDPQASQKCSTVLYDPSWHKGIIGIVASRLIEQHFRPTVLLTESDGKLVGSARSVPGFDLYEALDACSEHLLQWGGHKYAAGLSMKESAFPEFQQQFERVVAGSIQPEQRIPNLYIDQELSFREIDARFLRVMNRMEPFGPSNRRPVFKSSLVKVWNVKILKGAHLKLTVGQEDQLFEAIGFGMAAKWREMFSESEVIPGKELFEIAFQPIFNTWNNKTNINLRLKDIKFAHV